MVEFDSWPLFQLHPSVQAIAVQTLKNINDEHGRTSFSFGPCRSWRSNWMLLDRRWFPPLCHSGICGLSKQPFQMVVTRSWLSDLLELSRENCYAASVASSTLWPILNVGFATTTTTLTYQLCYIWLLIVNFAAFSDRILTQCSPPPCRLGRIVAVVPALRHPVRQGGFIRVVP